MNDKLFTPHPEQFEALSKDYTTENYMKFWNIMHSAQFAAAQKYAFDCNRAKQIASLGTL